LGIVIETVVLDPGKTGRIVVKCSDGTVIDASFNTSMDLPSSVGSLVVVERTAGSAITLHWMAPSTSAPSSVDKPIVPVWVEKGIADLDSFDARVREQANAALSVIDPEDLPSIYGLLQAQKHKSFRVRAAVGVILDRLAPLASSTLIELYLMPSVYVEKEVEALLHNAGPIERAELAEAKESRRRRQRVGWPRPPSGRSRKSKSAGHGTPPVKSERLVRCPVCGASVKEARLSKHKRKVHGRAQKG
jgi:hypothetical protein